MIDGALAVRVPPRKAPASTGTALHRTALSGIESPCRTP
ncbi:hypothetical protein [Azospirillum doebereinerae]